MIGPISQEYGSLYQVRQQIPEKSIYNGITNGRDTWYVARDRGLATVALSSEMVFNSNPRYDGSFTIKYSVGKSLGTYLHSGWFNSSTFTMAYHNKRLHRPEIG
ncbi:MAG: hypothetical protein QM669_15635 [Siphonobacter sp.]